ncbi:MAG: hypothetical protein NZ937_06830 [Armatimonadetes bacterium]|nr:hypothetical protein [Armatimonadota bacterium]
MGVPFFFLHGLLFTNFVVRCYMLRDLANRSVTNLSSVEPDGQRSSLQDLLVLGCSRYAMHHTTHLR